MAAEQRPPVKVLVMAGGSGLVELEPLLGRDRSARLERLLLDRATRWAQALAGSDGAVETVPSGSVRDAAARLEVDGIDTLTAIIWPQLPVWRAAMAAAALDDLASGCGVAIGPVFDGGLYLLAFTELMPELLTLPAHRWRGSDAIGAVVGATVGRELEIGLLRSERGLRRPEDVHALLADPLTDDELRALLH